MDSLITAAARALAVGDTLGALKRISLRDDPAALALRGIAMAQLGELQRARDLLRQAARAFGAHEELARARCVVADAEVALALREFRDSPRALVAAIATLDARADFANAGHARLIGVRRLLLLGRLDQAASALQGIDTHGLPPTMQSIAAMVSAELSLRVLQTTAARSALAHAHIAAERAQVAALIGEVKDMRALLDRTAARRVHADGEQPLRLDEVEALLGSGALLVDGCRRRLCAGTVSLPLARRPLLFTLLRTLAQAWPGDVHRHDLIAQAFRSTRPDETHRARLRVEIGRLRALIAPLAQIEASADGFKLIPRDACEVAVIVPPIDGDAASLLALLADGAAWSTSALALALGESQRTVQRTLVELEAEQRVRSVGRTRAQRWLAPPLSGFTTILLLPTALPLG